MTHPASSTSPDESSTNQIVPTSRPDYNAAPNNESQPRAKRIACVLCRKRKLRCDGARPKCATCNRLSHDCGYEEVRKKSGPKRGYVKLLEARLQQVETLLQKDGSEQTGAHTVHIKAPTITDTFQDDITNPRSTPYSSNHTSWSSTGPGLHDHNGITISTSTDLISLGLEEPLPLPEVVAELHEIYFAQLHPSIPMIHRPRYLAALNLAPGICPPPCLRYIMWALAASVSDKYSDCAEIFYRRARRYADMDEMKGQGEAIATLAHCQTWVLISWYEFKNLYFPRAWQDVGRACSFALMMGLNRLDGAGLDVKQCLPPPRDWSEREERRRTFWMAFSADRYASIGTGWAMRLDEQDILTLLPASDEAFEKGHPEITPSLEQAFSLSGSVNVSPIASVILIACLLGRNLTHLHRPTANDNEEDVNGEFWQRHRELESLLTNICLALPDHLRIPNGLPDSNVFFMNMLLHTTIICLHQAAIFKADRNRLPQSLIVESRARCVSSASELARIMKMMSHIDLSPMNPFIAFCLYVAARVFVQYLKWRPREPNMIASLQLLGSVMYILKRKNPLTGSFLAQLEVDLEGSGLVLEPKVLNPWSKGGAPTSNSQDKCESISAEELINNIDAVNCSPLFGISKSQTSQLLDDAIFRPPKITAADLNTLEANVGLATETAFPPNSSHNASQFVSQMPTRSKANGSFGSRPTLETENSNTPSTIDMDYSEPEKSRNDSYKDNSSHTSFTPPSVIIDDLQTQSYNKVQATSGMPNSMMNMYGDESMFFGATDDNLANFLGSQMLDSTSFMNVLEGQTKLPNGWDFGAAEVGTGLTPMSESQWTNLSQGPTSWSGM